LDRERLLFLHQCEGLTWHQLNQILKKDPELIDIFKMGVPEMMITFGVTNQTAKRIYRHVNHNSIRNLNAILKKNHIKAITVFDELYPRLLKTIFDPPWVLYGKGDWEILNHNKTISIVGTRNPSEEGLQALRKVAMPLIADSWTIVSGLAKGIDTYAHRLCTDNKGMTAAVLGSGHQNIYPKENIPLAETISKHGIVLSEFAPSVQPQRWHFPLRNRIISGLTRATLVAEAKKKSGSLITADQALEQGRDVYAIPGSILEERAEGTNQLIQNGAKLVMSAEDIRDEWPEYSSLNFETV
jgi:DNA processing protein